MNIGLIDFEYWVDYGVREREWGGPGDRRVLSEVAFSRYDIGMGTYGEPYTALVHPIIPGYEPTSFQLALTHKTRGDFVKYAINPMWMYSELISRMFGRINFAYGFDGLILAENLMHAGIEFTLHETRDKRPIFLNPTRDQIAMLMDFDDVVVFPIYSNQRREWMRSDTPLNDVILTVSDTRLFLQPSSIRIINVRPFINQADPSTVGLNSGKLAAHYGFMASDAEHDALHDIRSLGKALDELRRQGHQLESLMDHA